jgi:hypothetical protein
MAHKLMIICGSCRQPWDERHVCDVPPEIKFARYSDAALRRLAAQLALVLNERGALEEPSEGLVSMGVAPPVPFDQLPDDVQAQALEGPLDYDG